MLRRRRTIFVRLAMGYYRGRRMVPPLTYLWIDKHFAHNVYRGGLELLSYLARLRSVATLAWEPHWKKVCLWGMGLGYGLGVFLKPTSPFLVQASIM